MTSTSTRELRFVEMRETAFADAILEAVSKGAREVFLYPAGAAVEGVLRILTQNLPNDIAVGVLAELPSRLDNASCNTDHPAVFALVPDAEEELPDLLYSFLDWEGGWLIAPKTRNFSGNMPLFLVSIPKAGTHLLYELARRLGYRDGVELTGVARPAHWYCLEYSNSHTAAADFFVDSVRRAPFGNRAHPFPITPTLFIYRNPLDILVSEAAYYHRDGKTLFSGYLPQDSIGHRIDRLIDDRWLLGSIRDRLGKFLPWLQFSNVIPVSYEELVGARGGGDDAVRTRLIWSLQLKLHVDGNPEAIGIGLYDEDSPTFDQGVIGRYRATLSSQAFSRVFELGHDMLQLFGYEGSSLASTPFPPHRAEEFRNRRLVLGKVDHSKTPLTVEVFLGCNLVSYCGRYYAVPQWLGNLDFSALPLTRIAEFTSAGSLEELRGILSFGRQEYEYSRVRAAQRKQPQLLKDSYRGFNLAAFAGSLWAIEQAEGHLDFNRPAELQSWLKDGKLLNAGTVDGIRLAIDNLLERRKLQEGLSKMNARADAAEKHGAETARALVAEALDGLRRELEEARRRLQTVADELTEANAQTHAEADRRAKLASSQIADLADELRKEHEQSRIRLEAIAKGLDERLTVMRANLETGWTEVLDQRDRAIVSRVEKCEDTSQGQCKRLDERLNEMAASASALSEYIEGARAATNDAISDLATRFEYDIASTMNATNSATDALLATIEGHVKQLGSGIAESSRHADRTEQTVRELADEVAKLRAESAATFAQIEQHNAAVAWNPLIRFGLFVRQILKR